MGCVDYVWDRSGCASGGGEMLGMVHLGAGEWLDDLARRLQQRAEQRGLRLRERTRRGGWFLATDIHVRKAVGGTQTADQRAARGVSDGLKKRHTALFL